ncbi:MAG: hypothetical protein KGJ21_02525, partial [Pseudomonadota bacterium]|nr:hypothetical protein [Pseudomonadota bacterium]
SALVMLDPAAIETDAATYQFRSGGDGNGVTRARRYDCDRWDPILHGDPLLVHERLDGRVFVADGHHRLELAQRLNTAGAGPGPVAAQVLREADGYTAQDARIIAAYKNIARGQTDPVDTARVLKEADSGHVHTHLLPQLDMNQGNLALCHYLSKLPEQALGMVQSGDVPAVMAAGVAVRVQEPRQQVEVMQHLRTRLQQTSFLARLEQQGLPKERGM